jgi:hypothetical protein
MTRPNLSSGQFGDVRSNETASSKNMTYVRVSYVEVVNHFLKKRLAFERRICKFYMMFCHEKLSLESFS